MNKVQIYLFFVVFILSSLPSLSIHSQESSEPGIQNTPYYIHTDTDLLLEMAREGLKAKRYKQVAKVCSSILEKDKTNKEAHFLMGIAHHYLGEHDLAVEELRWVLLVDKNNAIAREFLEKSKKKGISQWDLQEVKLIKTAIQYHEEGLNGLAISTLKEVLKQNPKNTEAWELLGDIYKKAGNLTLAKSLYYKAVAPEKAKEINGEVKPIPREWWENLSKEEARLREINLQYAEIRNQAIKAGGRLSEFDKRSSERLDFEAKQLDQKVENTLTWQEKLQGTTAKPPEQQHMTADMLSKEAKLSQRPLLEYEIRVPEEEALRSLQSAFEEERSKMVEEMAEKAKEFEEVKSSMDRLEEELRHASF